MDENLRVLVVCNGGKQGKKKSVFVYEQISALRIKGVEVDIFPIVGGSPLKYLSNVSALRMQLRTRRYDLVHAHYGLSGVTACLGANLPVITTYHGSDINRSINRLLSRIPLRMSAYNVFVSMRLLELVSGSHTGRSEVLPCGVDFDTFYVVPRDFARRQLEWAPEEEVVLFGGAFSNKVKNAELARQVVEPLKGVKLRELHGYTRKEVNLAMNAADVLLLTSYSEGSPQVVKEAMACGLPIVSVDVGDVRALIGDTEGCSVTTHDVSELQAALRSILARRARTNGRDRLAWLSNSRIAERLIDIYLQIRRDRIDARSGVAEDRVSRSSSSISARLK